MMVFPTRATSNQMVDWGRTELALTLNIPKENVWPLSPFVGGGFGAKLFLRTDALLAALGARAARSGACAFNAGIERAPAILDIISHWNNPHRALASWLTQPCGPLSHRIF